MVELLIPNDVCGYKPRDSKWSGLGRFQAFDLLISDTEVGAQKHNEVPQVKGLEQPSM